MSADPPSRARQPAVELLRRPMWRIRLARELPRYMLCALSAFGIAASARFAVAPPRPLALARAAPAPAPPDRAAEAYATLFARRYLSWNSAEPGASDRALQPFAGPGVEPGFGLMIPPGGEQSVEWAEVAQSREPSPGIHTYTVAAQTDAVGVIYLSVGVTSGDEGLAVLGYPAIVGAPASGPARLAERLPEVEEPALETVTERALRNYLADSPSELAADLSVGAGVSLPAMSMRLLSVQRLDWLERPDTVLAVLDAEDSRGAQYTLSYELDVVRQQGRWEISAVQTDPDSQR